MPGQVLLFCHLIRDQLLKERIFSPKNAEKCGGVLIDPENYYTLQFQNRDVINYVNITVYITLGIKAKDQMSSVDIVGLFQNLKKKK